MKYVITFLLLFFFEITYAQKDLTFGRDDLKKVGSAPNYLELKYWAAHPEKDDAADQVPGKGELRDQQPTAQVDVFFVHPTIYTKRQNASNPWNADVNDEDLNDNVDESTIKYQASVFNGSARVYAPRYRQAHYNVFATEDLILKQRALDFAYEDVKKAFETYLEKFNQGRPLVIASHSQGTLHAARLIKDFIEGKPLQNQLVAAYLVGMPLDIDLFESISPCKNPSETGCWMTWNTYRKGYFPASFHNTYQNALTVNPLNWRITQTYAPSSKNEGGILKNFKKIRPGINDAVNHQGVLWVSKPKFFGNFLFNRKRYHVIDYNLFYVNIRENLALRASEFLNME